MSDYPRYAERPDTQSRMAMEHARYGDHTGCYQRQCYVCGMTFYAAKPHAELCSERCNQTATLRRRHASQITERYCTCGMCNTQFLARRKDTRYCSPKCKQKAYRRRVTDTVTAEKP